MYCKIFILNEAKSFMAFSIEISPVNLENIRLAKDKQNIVKGVNSFELGKKNTFKVQQGAEVKGSLTSLSFRLRRLRIIKKKRRRLRSVCLKVKSSACFDFKLSED
jgi:hypothetical protein